MDGSSLCLEKGLSMARKNYLAPPAKRGRQAGAPAANGEGKVIRDAFTMPMADYELIEPLKERCMRAGIGINKSELLRAGLQALTRMSDRQLTRHLERLIRV